MTEPLIDINDVSFGYDQSVALNRVSLSLNKNDFYVFLGPNGGGKTTLMKLIMGILSPKKGSININGKKPRSQRTEFGYIPQKLYFDAIFPLSVFEFVQQGLLSQLPWHGVWPADTYDQTYHILDEFSISNLQKKSIGELSGGQLQRAIIARALISNPNILILDEPFSGLDNKSSQQVIELIEKLKGKKTIILITHVLTYLLKQASRVFLVEKTVTPLSNDDLCEHINLGLYHDIDGGCNHE